MFVRVLFATTPPRAEPTADPADCAVLYNPNAVPRFSDVISDIKATEVTYNTPKVRPCKSCIGKIRHGLLTIV